jgi:hypothetical protein
MVVVREQGDKESEVKKKGKGTAEDICDDFAVLSVILCEMVALSRSCIPVRC